MDPVGPISQKLSSRMRVIALGRQPMSWRQISCGFVVIDVDGRVEALGGQGQRHRQIFPRPRDRFALVIVAEREVAEHLQERAVPAAAADVLDVVLAAGHAQAALHGDDARRRRGLRRRTRARTAPCRRW